jgi:hypothetical protein
MRLPIFSTCLALEILLSTYEMTIKIHVRSLATTINKKKRKEKMKVRLSSACIAESGNTYHTTRFVIANNIIVVPYINHYITLYF